MAIDITILFGVISCALAVATFLAGRLSASKSDGKQDGTILAEIGYLKSGIDDIKRKMDENDRRYLELAQRVASVEASAKQAHKRLDDHLGKGGEER